VQHAAERLGQAGIADAAHEAAQIIASAQQVETGNWMQAAEAMIARRAAGIPLAYVTGRETFMGLTLLADEGALVPRAETELLARTAIGLLAGGDRRVIDMCCGSGNLACAIAHHVPQARVWASDLTEGCTRLARRNVAHLGLGDRVSVVQGDLFGGLAGLALEGTIDAVVCNPPYISQGKLATERAELLKFEPREAFDGGPYGLSIHQRVIRDALGFLKPDGPLLFEIGLGQERQVRALFERSKGYGPVQSVSDAEGNARVVWARKAG
jgi:release factor glutamine methyltransferase